MLFTDIQDEINGCSVDVQWCGHSRLIKAYVAVS